MLTLLQRLAASHQSQAAETSSPQAVACNLRLLRDVVMASVQCMPQELAAHVAAYAYPGVVCVLFCVFCLDVCMYVCFSLAPLYVSVEL